MSIVVLLSGGLDSVTLATLAKRAGVLSAAVFVDYGQPARQQELTAARRWSSLQRARLYEISATPHGVEAMEGVGLKGPRIVPCRNLVLVSLAATVAASIGAQEVWYGATGADQKEYADCRPVYAQAMTAVLEPFGVSAHAPLAGMRRSDVCLLAKALGVVVGDTWSCYSPDSGGKPCGACNSCLQPKESTNG